MADDHRIHFAGFAFDPRTGELDGPAGATRLPPKAARLLQLLAERRGELVSREALRDELWPDQHVELDQVLAYTVRQVRLALGDDGTTPRLVETLPRRGYRLLVEPAVGTAGDPVGGAAGEEGAGPRLLPPTSDRQPLVDGAAGMADPGPRRASPLLSALGAAALFLLAVALLAALVRPRPPASAAPLRVALLPLGEPGLEASNDPLTEGLVVALTARPELDLVAQATTAPLRGTRRPHTEVGRELGVAYVVSGGYRPAAGFLFLQVVRTSDGRHIFARRFHGDPAAVDGQLDAAAAAIAERLMAEPPPAPAHQPDGRD